MFCPKCGSQNSDETKYCRGCGVDVSGVIAAVEGRPPDVTALAEKHIDLFSRGLRGLVMGVGFLFVAIVAFGISSRLAVLAIFALAFAFVFLGTGISRLVQASGMKRLRKASAEQPALTPGTTEYVKPARSLYETDDLIALPASVTDHTTHRLKMDPDEQ